MAYELPLVRTLLEIWGPQGARWYLDPHRGSSPPPRDRKVGSGGFLEPRVGRIMDLPDWD